MAKSIFQREPYKTAVENVMKKRRNRQQQQSVGSGGRRRYDAIDAELMRMERGQTTDHNN